MILSKLHGCMYDFCQIKVNSYIIFDGNEGCMILFAVAVNN